MKALRRVVCWLRGHEFALFVYGRGEIQGWFCIRCLKHRDIVEVMQ